MKDSVEETYRQHIVGEPAMSAKTKVQIFVAAGLAGAAVAPAVSTRFVHKNIFIGAHFFVGIGLVASGFLLSINQELPSVATIGVTLLV